MYLVLLIGPIVIAWKYIHFRVERAKVFKMGFEAGALYAGMAAEIVKDEGPEDLIRQLGEDEVQE